MKCVFPSPTTTQCHAVCESSDLPLCVWTTHWCIQHHFPIGEMGLCFYTFSTKSIINRVYFHESLIVCIDNREMRASTISAYFNCLQSIFNNIAPWRGLNKIYSGRAFIDLFDSDLITSKRLMALLNHWERRLDLYKINSQPTFLFCSNKHCMAGWKQRYFHGGSLAFLFRNRDYHYFV